MLTKRIIPSLDEILRNAKQGDTTWLKGERNGRDKMGLTRACSCSRPGFQDKGCTHGCLHERRGI